VIQCEEWSQVCGHAGARVESAGAGQDPWLASRRCRCSGCMDGLFHVVLVPQTVRCEFPFLPSDVTQIFAASIYKIVCAVVLGAEVRVNCFEYISAATLGISIGRRRDFQIRTFLRRPLDENSLVRWFIYLFTSICYDYLKGFFISV